MTRAVVTGGAGFVGSALCERLLEEGLDVLCLDSLLTGRERNIAHLLQLPGFAFERSDVTHPLEVAGGVDFVLHLASPASPRDYQRHPIHTLKVGSVGAWRSLGLARAKKAAFLLASTSEVYGDPLVHPQPEGYWGNANPIGARSCYDESKRFAEALAVAYERSHGMDVRIARIFNTYGPRMQRTDGRAVPTFIDQALRGAPLTVHGDGRQTRSLCFIDDLVEGLWRLLMSPLSGPINVGNPQEVTILELAELVAELCGTGSPVTFAPRPADDPELRRPDITRAEKELGWRPRVGLREGLQRTIRWAKHNWFGAPEAIAAP